MLRIARRPAICHVCLNQKEGSVGWVLKHKTVQSSFKGLHPLLDSHCTLARVKGVATFHVFCFCFVSPGPKNVNLWFLGALGI